MFELIYYRTSEGRCPIEEYLSELDSKAFNAVSRAFEALRQNGPKLRRPISGSLGDGLFELRVDDRSNARRVIYFFMQGEQAILTNGFNKKTNKTPRQEIERAKRYREDHLKRH